VVAFDQKFAARLKALGIKLVKSTAPPDSSLEAALY
jgi:hypothetical protein